MNSDFSLVRQSLSEVVYSVGKYSDISYAQILKLRETYTGANVFIFRPREVSYPDLACLDQTMPDNIFCQLGFRSLSGSIPRLPFVSDLGEISDRCPTGHSELKYWTEKTYADDFASDWLGYLGRAQIDQNLEILLNVSRPESTRLVLRKGVPIGMVSLYPTQDCIGTELQQIGWIWVERGLSSPVRLATHALLAQWLSRQEGQGGYQAGVHLKNIRSQRFFLKLGFLPACVHCFVQ